MFGVVLYEPAIPPNTGNALRPCANAGCRLHPLQPLGFLLTEPALRRAGLDDAESAAATCTPTGRPPGSIFPAAGRSRSPRARRAYAGVRFAPGDALVFGPETRGLPDALLAEFAMERRLRIPMRPGSRSINRSNAVALAVYEAWRQSGFAGAAARQPSI